MNRAPVCQRQFRRFAEQLLPFQFDFLGVLFFIASKVICENCAVSYVQGANFFGSVRVHVVSNLRFVWFWDAGNNSYLQINNNHGVDEEKIRDLGGEEMILFIYNWMNTNQQGQIKLNMGLSI